MEKELLIIIIKAFKLKKKTEFKLIKNITFDQLENFDSLNFLKFIFSLEKKFKVKINPNNLKKMNSPISILKYFKSKKYKKLR